MNLAKSNHAYGNRISRYKDVVVILAIIIAAFLDIDVIMMRVLLIGSVTFVMIVEILNSAIEAVVDRIGPKFHELSGRAKDMGSAVVLMTILLTGALHLDLASLGTFSIVFL